MQLDNEELLYRLFHSYSVKLFPAKSVVHRCSCSRERTARALNAIGEDEVMTIVAEEGVVEVNCEFCARRYEYTEAELRLLFESPTGEPLH
jgi:molecular chaperone Hsp33